jgi:Sigma-70 region 2
MPAGEASFDFEAMFRAQYRRIARVIAKVVRDPSRAEELAVEVFLKLWRNRKAHGENVEGWLYRAAVRKGWMNCGGKLAGLDMNICSVLAGGFKLPKMSAAPTMNRRESVWCSPTLSLAKPSCCCSVAMDSATKNWHPLSI